MNKITLEECLYYELTRISDFHLALICTFGYFNKRFIRKCTNRYYNYLKSKEYHHQNAAVKEAIQILKN